jgi:DNA-binding GntR family transcriptional regulator
MTANIVSEKRIPLYQQITLTLKQRIKMGQYKPGLSLPSVRTLSEEFKVSPGIVYCAIRDLEENGVVSTRSRIAQ